uniref:Uncharacterized protein n=1 Tax=Cacopsylla melanoneura TaxID=428564 RepID=A0A8D8RIE3_9HEMI
MHHNYYVCLPQFYTTYMLFEFLVRSLEFCQFWQCPISLCSIFHGLHYLCTHNAGYTLNVFPQSAFQMDTLYILYKESPSSRGILSILILLCKYLSKFPYIFLQNIL